jgi:hypothetical protein
MVAFALMKKQTSAGLFRTVQGGWRGHRHCHHHGPRHAFRRSIHFINLFGAFVVFLYWPDKKTKPFKALTDFVCRLIGGCVFEMLTPRPTHECLLVVYRPARNPAVQQALTASVFRLFSPLKHWHLLRLDYFV